MSTNNNPVCPLCGSTIVEKEKLFECNTHKRDDITSCKFVLWKDTLSRFGKAEVEAGEVAQLVTGQQIFLKLVSPKTGKPFSCKGELDNYNGRYGVRFVFPEKPLVPAPATAPADEPETETETEDY